MDKPSFYRLFRSLFNTSGGITPAQALVLAAGVYIASRIVSGIVRGRSERRREEEEKR